MPTLSQRIIQDILLALPNSSKFIQLELQLIAFLMELLYCFFFYYEDLLKICIIFLQSKALFLKDLNFFTRILLLLLKTIQLLPFLSDLSIQFLTFFFHIW